MPKISEYFKAAIMGLLGVWIGGLLYLLPLLAVESFLDVKLVNPWLMMWAGAAGGYMVGILPDSRDGTSISRQKPD